MTIDQYVYCQMCPRFLANVCFVKCIILWINFYQNTNVVSGNITPSFALVLSKAFGLLRMIFCYQSYAPMGLLF